MSIVETQKFHETAAGHVGSGTYFWAYEKVEDYGIELAVSWWQLVSKNPATSTYKEDADPSCAVIGVRIKRPDSENYLDATEDWFQEALYVAISKKSCEKSDVPEVTALLIAELQEAVGNEYQVIKAKVFTPPAPPKIKANSVQMFSKMSNSYIVKKPGIHLIEDIKILR